MSTPGTPFPHEETIDVLAEIREELTKLSSAVIRIIGPQQGSQEALLRIAACVESWHAGKRPEIVHAIPESTVANLLEALGLVRLVLDTGGPGLPGSPNAQRLFEAEHLLSRELGQPIWDSPLRPEGRRS